MRRHFLTYLALSTMAVAQPLLDLYGKNPTIFSASKMSTVESAFFVLAILLGPAVAATLLDRVTRWFGPKVNESMRLWLIAGFSFLLGLAIARWLNVDGNVGSLAIGALVAVVLPLLYDTQKVIREWSRWLAILSVAVLANAVLQLQPVLFMTNGPQSDAVIKNSEVSVFQIVFDEFPLYALLAEDGTINAERYPGFAKLASESTWFRNAVAESNFTHQAVPALLASVVPQQAGGPFLAQYPKNIFTVFAGKTAVGGIEPVTSLCPPDVCGGSTGSTGSFSPSRVKSFFRDASYVYAHRVFPPFLRSRVPSIEGAWGGFGAVADKFKEQFGVGALSQIDALGRGVKAMVNDPSPRVQVTHVLLPHAPWRVTPDMRVAPLSKAISTANPESEDGVRDTYQTFLYQLAAADKAISEAMSTLKEAGRWDNTLFIVSADHGISFLPTLPQRHTDFVDMEQANDIYRVPLLMKFPNQVAASVSDCAVTNLDVLPTILEVTGTTTSWEFAGESVAQECPSGRERRVVSATGESQVFSGGFGEARDRARHYATVVSNVGNIRRVAAVGSSASLIGQPVTSAGASTAVASWTLNQKKMFTKVSDTRGSRVPSLITGTISLTGPTEIGTEGVVVINGVAAGVIGELSGVRDVVEYTAILDYSLLTDGAHTVELYVRSADGTLSKVGAPK
ncbi:MAG: sulfatase-like hydrolase/transferase [Acidimicrobiaceae bacterium]